MKSDFVPTAINKAIETLKSTKPTEGRVCAIGSIRCIPDWLLASMTSKNGEQKLFGKNHQDVEDWVKSEFLELIKGIAKDGATEGFASNASAAAKAAGHKPEEVTSADIDNMTE